MDQGIEKQFTNAWEGGRGNDRSLQKMILLQLTLDTKLSLIKHLIPALVIYHIRYFLSVKRKEETKSAPIERY